MRILLVTFGSLGDLHPMLALGRELQRRGHEAVIATSEYFRDRVTGFGLPFAAVRPDFRLDDETLVRRIMAGRRGTEFLLRDLVYPSVRIMHADLAPLARAADMMVSSEIACAAPVVAAEHALRWVFFALSPISFLSATDPSVLPGPRAGRVLPHLGVRANRFVFQLAKAVSYRWWAPVRQLRRELRLPPGRSPLFEGKFSPQLNLALFSRALQPPQPDWPAHTRQTGFCFFDEETPAGHASAAATAGLPPRVAQFLAAGEAPLVFTLGSAAVHLARDFYAVSAEAAQRLGRRALLLLGKNPAPPNLPPSTLAWDYLPYAQIFPRAAAIVHQGGIGTTAQTLRAGRPMLVVPFAHDQFDNAARVTRLGGGATLARGRYRAATAERALRSLLDDAHARSRAAEIAARIHHENGARAAADALEAQLHLPVARLPSPARRAAHSA